MIQLVFPFGFVTHVDLVMCPKKNVSYNSANLNKQFNTRSLSTWNWINRSKCLTSFQAYIFPLFKVGKCCGIVLYFWLVTLDQTFASAEPGTITVKIKHSPEFNFVPNAHLWYIGSSIGMALRTVALATCGELLPSQHLIPASRGQGSLKARCSPV